MRRRVDCTQSYRRRASPFTHHVASTSDVARRSQRCLVRDHLSELFAADGAARHTSFETNDRSLATPQLALARLVRGCACMDRRPPLPHRSRAPCWLSLAPDRRHRDTSSSVAARAPFVHRHGDYLVIAKWKALAEYRRAPPYKSHYSKHLPYAPRGTRTPNLLIRSQTLYPIELWAPRCTLQPEIYTRPARANLNAPLDCPPPAPGPRFAFVGQPSMRQ